MYDPFAQPHPIDPGTMQTMTAPATLAVMPNPTPLSPNNALASSVSPAMGGSFDRGGEYRMGPGGVMRTPGGPMQSPGVQAVRGQQPDHQAFQLAMRSAPDDAARDQIRADFLDQMNQWHSNIRTALDQFHQQQRPDWRASDPTPLPVDPVMTPGGGGTGAPVQAPTGQFPLNPAPPSNDWRTMRTSKQPSYGI